LVFTLCAGALGAQDGAILYKTKCAQCHDHPVGRIPTVSALRAMTRSAILNALDNGSMKAQAPGLSEAQRQGIAEYLASSGSEAATNACAGGSAVAPKNALWANWGADPANTRFQNAARGGLRAVDVPALHLKWAFNLGKGTTPRSQPAVAFGMVFVGAERKLFALDAQTGCTRWVFQADAPVRTGISINPDQRTIFFGAHSTVYALNAETGKVLWKRQADEHPAAVLTGTPASHGDVLYVPVASFEEATAASPQYPCCTFRGSVVALNAATGETLWKTYTIEKRSAAGEHGPSGAAIWSTPTFDETRGVLYVSTGDNYSQPATATSDAVLALDAKTGKLLWTRQITANDIYNIACDAGVKSNCPSGRGRDFDFGQPPILLSRDGKRFLVIGQKSGVVSALDPDAAGRLIWSKRIGNGGALGGIQWGSAAENGRVYVALSDVQLKAVPDKSAAQGVRLVLNPEQGGGLFALDAATGAILWSAKPSSCNGKQSCSPAQSAPVTAIPGAVFSGSLDGHLRAYSTENGQVIWDEDTEREYDSVNGGKVQGGSLDVTGPVIAGGFIYVMSGYGTWGGVPGNALLAYESPVNGGERSANR
jgi:polyvinyl alcohol dehydrogenase (cytochrome)